MIVITVGLGVFFLLTFLGQEIFLSMAAAAVAIIFFQDMGLDFVQVIPQTMLFGIESVELAAIPLFILAGELMNASSITTRNVKFFRAAIGHIRGGLSMVAVVVNMIMAGVSGSAVADASATGTVLIPAMKKDGYDPAYAAAVIASAATIGPVIPPSVPMIIFAVLTNTSIIKLFLGGAVPGLIMGFALILVCYVIARIKKFPTLPRVKIREVLRVGFDSLWALIMPLFIILGIVSGIATVTEIASIAVAYAAFVGVFVYREIKIKDIPGILRCSALMSAVILITLATANAFAWFMVVLEIGPMLRDIVGAISNNPIIILLVINFFLLLIGCVFEPIPAMIIFIPVLMPLVKSVGIDLIHFGVIMVFNLMLGLLTPPVGLNFYITATIAEVPAESVIVRILPFLVVLVMVMVLCILLPQVVIWLPAVLLP